MASLHPPPAPTLPSFKSILFEGKYHPSAPIHLCLSHTASQPEAKALLLSSDPRQNLTSALEDYNDDWLSTDAGCGNTSAVSSRIDVYYPPSPAHLALLLSMIRVSQPLDNNLPYNSKTTFDVVPTLIVLHEPSAYFLRSSAENSHTTSSYLKLIAQALASVSFLSVSANNPGGISFAVFDSLLDQLKLHVLGPQRNGEGMEGRKPSDELEPVAPLARKYFEWVGTFQQSLSLPDSSPLNPTLSGDLEQKNLLKLRCQNQGIEVVWNWSEVAGPERGASERRSTIFVWC